MEKNKIKLGIIGLGLIGSSILKGLYKNNDYEIFCISNSSYKKALKYTKKASSDINDIKKCDIIFVCSDISKTEEYLEKLDKILPKNTIVCDVASIKKDLINKKYNFNFILTHPMAGSEKTGFSAGYAGLFKNAKWLFEKENEILIKVIKDLKAIPLKIKMKNHDELTAQISHLPTILSFLVFDMAQNEAKKIASSGFRDMTRLSMTSDNLALNMFNNKNNVLKYFDIIVKKMETLKNLTDNEKIQYFRKISKKRTKMYDKFGKNIF